MTTTCHPLPAGDRALADAALAEVGTHFQSFAGTPRAAYDAMTAWTPMASGVEAEEVTDGTVRGWWLRPQGAPARRAILFLHGGAYLFGSARGYRGLASQIAARTGVAVFVLDYPLAPEHPFPAAPDAARAAVAWLARSHTDLALVGDSAGGALALHAGGAAGASAASVTSAASVVSIASIVVFSPWVDLTLAGTSMQSPATHDPVFQRAMLSGAAATYLAGAAPADGRASPLFAVPSSLPPLAIQVGTDELLLDDARRYAAAAAGAGTVQLDVYEGMHHVFQRTPALTAARHALDAAAQFIDTHWPA